MPSLMGKSFRLFYSTLVAFLLLVLDTVIKRIIANAARLFNFVIGVYVVSSCKLRRKHGIMHCDLMSCCRKDCFFDLLVVYSMLAFGLANFDSLDAVPVYIVPGCWLKCSTSLLPSPPPTPRVRSALAQKFVCTHDPKCQSVCKGKIKKTVTFSDKVDIRLIAARPLGHNQSRHDYFSNSLGMLQGAPVVSPGGFR